MTFYLTCSQIQMMVSAVQRHVMSVQDREVCHAQIFIAPKANVLLILCVAAGTVKCTF